MAGMMIVIIVESAMVEKIVNDGGSCPRVDVGREQMIEFGSVQIIRSHS
jgi:hypothetical protein